MQPRRKSRAIWWAVFIVAGAGVIYWLMRPPALPPPSPPLTLPDGSSVELMNWIFATRPALRGRTFVLSGGAVEDADIAFVRSGVVPVLRKPIEPGPLLQILGRARAGLGSSV